MSRDFLKIYIYENNEIIKTILENIGMTYVRRIRDSHYICGFEGSKRRDSVNVRIDTDLSTVVWSKNENIKDLFDLVKYQMGLNFFEAIQYVSNLCGIKSNRKISNLELYLKKPKIEKKPYKRIISKPLSNKCYEFYTREECDLFTKDGISREAQRHFKVGCDALENRIVFPVLDYDGNLLTFKGRTLDNNYAQNGIPKYLYYHNFNGRYYLFGYFENYWDILDSEYIIITESEKAVMQGFSFDVRNVVATSKKRISEEQVEEIKALKKKVVIAYDKDVDEYEVRNECAKFEESYYLIDKEGLLGKKDSPFDRGRYVFDRLWEGMVKYEV